MPKRRPMILDQDVHDQLKRAVHDSPLSATWLAQQLGRDRTTLYKWLDGTNAIPPKLLQQLCMLLNLPSEQCVAQFAARGYAIPRVLLQPAHHLRAPVADFVGRAHELERIVAALAAGDTSTPAAICGVRGMGGIGKTELVMMAAHRLAPHFPDGQVVVELRGVGAVPMPAAQALQTVVRAFQPDAKFPDDLGELQGRYRSHLHGKRILILADDAHDAAQVRPLLPPSGCALLITSRQRFTLPGMVQIDLGALLGQEAEQLLRAICPRIGGAAPTLAGLCGHLPLALRVAGSLLASMDMYPVERYLTQLEAERLKYLRDPDEPYDPQASVEASFALSYTALEPASRQALDELSVFPGDFDLPAAAAVLAPARGDPEMMLGQLRRRSLVEWDPERERYQLHDLVREFARARLGDARAARQRHAEYFLRLAEQDGEASEGTWHTPWLDRMELEYANLRYALDWLMQSDAAPLALRLATALGPFWFGRDHLDEGSSRLQMALARTSAGYEYVRAQALAHLGALQRVRGYLGVARRAYEESRALFRQLEHEEHYADVVFKLGLVISDQGEKRAARAYFEESLAYFRRHSRSSRVATVLSNLGRASLDAGNYPDAQRYYAESYALMRATGDTEELAWLFVNLARLASVQNDYAAALQHADQSLRLFTQLGHSQGQAWGLLRKGAILTTQGDYAGAYACLSDSQARFERLGNSVGSAMVYHSLAQLALISADEPCAWQYACLCFDLFHQLGNMPGVSMAIELIARLTVRSDVVLAIQLLGVAEALRTANGVVLEPAERTWHVDTISVARAQLPATAFVAAWEEGAALPLERVSQLVLRARVLRSGASTSIVV